jgi:ABC-type xylose transport system permease subunit
LNVSTNFTQFFTGLVLIIAVTIDYVSHKGK